MRLLFLSIALALGPTAAAAQPARDTGAVAVARPLIERARAADHVPAMAVAIVQGERLVWNEAFGTADLEQGVAATAATRFRIASVSKVFTATLAARLAQTGRIDLDRPIRDYLPAWPARHAPITLRQLLGHLGGVRHYIPRDTDFSAVGRPIDLRIYPDRASILAVFADDDLVSTPGQAFHYSTFGYALIGQVLEAATGRSYFELLDDNVLRPAGIEGVAVDHLFALTPSRAAPYDPVADYDRLLPAAMGPVVNALPLNSAYKIAAGGLVADAASVARFGALHFAPGFLNEGLYRQMFTPQRTASGEATSVGLGWEIATDAAGRTVYFHTGSQQGSRAIVLVYPRERLSLAILSNLGHRPAEIRALALAVAAPFLP